MQAIAVIAGREIRTAFYSPLAWSVLALVQLVVGIVFVVQLQVFLDPPKAAAVAHGWGLTRVVAAPLFNWTAFIFVLVVPVLSMRVLSEERRAGTLVLLLAAPISAASIIVGKFLGLLAVLATQIALVAALPVLLLIAGGLDFGQFAAQLLGLGLLAMAFAAFGLWVSSTTATPTLAALGTLAGLMMSWLLGWRGPSEVTSELAEWIHHLSWQVHLDPFLTGTVDSADAAYFLIGTLTFLTLATVRIAALREDR